MQMTQYLTIEQFAEKCPLSIPSIRRLINKGELDHAQPGGKGSRILIPVDALERCTRRAEAQPGVSARFAGAPVGGNEKTERLPGLTPKWRSRSKFGKHSEN